MVTRATEKVNLANKYNELADKGVGIGLVKKEDVYIQQYVAGKLLDGLKLIIAEEEENILQDAVDNRSAILQKVFGSLK